MSTMKMHLGYQPSALELAFDFIDHYMTGCAPVYPLIYIFGLRRLLGGEAVTVQEIAIHFGLLDTDVENAWRHFERVGLVALDESGGEFSITFLPVVKPGEFSNSFNSSKDEKAEKPEKAAKGPSFVSITPPTPAEKPVKAAKSPADNIIPLAMPEGRPHYSVQELAMYRSQSKDIERLFTKAELTLGKLLTYNDMNVIFGFYDWLRLPLDVIEYLLSYCAEHGQRNLRYIEKCAMDWAERDIDDLEKALVYANNFDKSYRSILKRMGKLSSFPTPAQRKQMDKWLHEMNLPLELVLEACDRTSLSAEKPSLSYVDKILAKWHKDGVTSLGDVQQADDDFAKAKAAREAAKADGKENREPKVKGARNNRFINFEQRENDYSQIEKMEQQYLLQRLKG